MRQKGIINRMHKGLRTWLFETGIKIQETDFLELAQGREIAADLRNIIMVIERKSSIDEKYVFPILVKQAPFFVNIMDTENQKIKRIADQLGGFLNYYIEPGTTLHHMSTGFSIQQVYNELMGAVLTYMNRLELMLKELESAAGSEGIIYELEEALLLNLDFGKVVMPKEWIFKSLNDNELEQFLTNRYVLRNAWLSREMSRIAQSRLCVNQSENGGNLRKMVAA
jgi:hypothetical protein